MGRDIRSRRRRIIGRIKFPTATLANFGRKGKMFWVIRRVTILGLASRLAAF